LRGPVFEPIRRDPELFRKVKVERGTLCWARRRGFVSRHGPLERTAAEWRARLRRSLPQTKRLSLNRRLDDAILVPTIISPSPGHSLGLPPLGLPTGSFGKTVESRARRDRPFCLRRTFATTENYIAAPSHVVARSRFLAICQSRIGEPRVTRPSDCSRAPRQFVRPRWRALGIRLDRENPVARRSTGDLPHPKPEKGQEVACSAPRYSYCDSRGSPPTATWNKSVRRSRPDNTCD
jgi:hypothetical protein